MFKRLILGIILGIMISFFAFNYIVMDKSINKFSNSEIEDKDENKVTFTVIIPENTPEEDIIYMYYYQPDKLDKIKMDKIGDFTFEKSFSIDELENTNGFFHYRYGRNGWNFIPSEYLEPNTNDYFWTEIGRKISYPKIGEKIEDEIERWRWFPEGNLDNSKEDVSLLGPKEGVLFPERIQGFKFASGQVVQDLYLDGFDDFFDSTAEQLVEKGYTWVGIAPPWQWIEQEPLPKIGNAIEFGIEGSPNYPNDEMLIKHIKAFKDVGLKVIIGPQDCCISINTEGRSREWMEKYYSEMKRFLIHFAKISEQSGADAFYNAVSGVDTSSSEESWVRDLEKEKWIEIWGDVRNEFSGLIGQGVWSFDLQGYPDIIPQAEYITWGDELDFFYYMGDAKLSEKENPSDEELIENAGKALDGAKEIHDLYGKPIWLQTAYFSVKGSWKAGNYDDIGNGIPGEGEDEVYSNGFEYSGLDQARVVNAYFEAIKERPWIIGYNGFGYWHWEMPKLPDWNVRGKEAEDVWEKWNGVI